MTIMIGTEIHTPRLLARSRAACSAALAVVAVGEGPEGAMPMIMMLLYVSVEVSRVWVERTEWQEASKAEQLKALV
jgi:hypothetical protein